MRQQPGQRDLSRGGVFPCRDLTNQLDEALVGLAGVGAEPRNGVAEVGAVEARRLVDLAGEEALGECVVGEAGDVLALAGMLEVEL